MVVRPGSVGLGLTISVTRQLHDTERGKLGKAASPPFGATAGRGLQSFVCIPG